MSSVSPSQKTESLKVLISESYFLLRVPRVAESCILLDVPGGVYRIKLNLGIPPQVIN
jgi:hypothetical protein